MPSYPRLMIASSKGGVGKSSAALGIAVSLAEAGRRTLLIDLDFTSRCLDLLSGAQDKALFNFTDLAAGRPLEECVITPYEKIPSLFLLSASPADQLEAAAGAAGLSTAGLVRKTLRTVMEEENDFEFFICDTGAGLSLAVPVADLFDTVLIPSEQSLTSVRSAESAAEKLEAAGAIRLRLLISAFDPQAVRREQRAGLLRMIDSCALPCAGVIPYDPSLQKAQDKGELPERDSPFMTACRNVARRMEGENVYLFDGMKRLRRRMEKAF